MNLSQVSALSEDQAREYIEAIRWPEGPVCPHCDSKEVTRLQGKSTRPGLFKCKNKDCRKQFTVKVKTILEDSHIPYRHWLMAFHLMCSSKKGVSAHQIHRSIGCTYKTAWFLCHRIRYAMEQGAGLLSGTIEADETYCGGKPRYKGQSKDGRGTNKTPVVALVERGGQVRAKVVTNVTAENVRKHLKANATPDSILMTDEFRAYTKVGREFADHKVIKHKSGIYSQGDVNTNTIESYFSLIKRGLYGTFHHVSDHHLKRYVNEFSFRWNNRKSDDGVRTTQAIAGAEGKRLTYR